MIKQLFIDIESRILALKDQENNSVIKHTDLWNNNVMFIEQETPFLTPACFIEFVPIAPENLDTGQTFQVVPQIRLHVVTEWFGGTGKNIPPEAREKALQYLDVSDSLWPHLLSDQNSDLFIKLIGILPNHDHEKYVDSIQTYELETQIIES